MLVFFIHGVATRNVNYANQLQNLIKNDFFQRGKTRPYFYASFWGDLLNDRDKIWRDIEDNLRELTQENQEIDLNNVFRYQEIREGFISDFFGDILTYFNQKRGWKIRKLIAEQLKEYLREYPEEKELHIIAHSLGTVIIWDTLFSDRFEEDDPAFHIREMINHNPNAINLKSITTMGSPILYINMMLGINKEQIHQMAQNLHILRWLNIIHSSDLVAYPIKHSFKKEENQLFIRDKYIIEDANLAEKTAYSLGQMHAASALGVTDAHISYWNSEQTAKIIVDNILGNYSALEKQEIPQKTSFWGL